MKHSLKIEPSGIFLEVEDGTLLSDVLAKYDFELPCGGKGVCGNCKVKVLSGKVNKVKQQELLIKKNLSDEWCLACYTKVENDLVIEILRGEMSIQSDQSKVETSVYEEGFGIAVDLGSTTVVSQLVNLETGKVVDSRTGINSQSVFGADIISRISYAIEKVDNLKKLSTIIRSLIQTQIEEMISLNVGISRKVKKVKIVGNTVMHHLFCGFDVKCLAVAPFQSDKNNNYYFTPKQLGWNLPEDCVIEFLPNISHFVGSDVLAGILSCGMAESDEYSLLVDLGTNGEIALGNRDKIWCTSTAAGPAFEGINISCGMRASSGAISEVDYKDGKFIVSTIDKIPAKGLCGSGLIETVHCLLKQGMIDCFGIVVENGEKEFELSNGVSITFADIREFQLAKAAIATGVQLLFKYCALQPENISYVYLTGGLGNYLNSEKILQLGIIPDISSSKYKRLSNAALYGCKRFLYDAENKKSIEILNKISYCPLETDKDFMDLYCNNMLFPYDWI